MAQNFKQIKLRKVGTAVTDIPDGTDFPTGYHTLIGLNLSNRTSNAITVSAFITNNLTDADDDPTGDNKEYYIVKDMTIPSGSSYAYDSKIVLLGKNGSGADGDRIWVQSSAADSLDVIASYVQDIST